MSQKERMHELLYSNDGRVELCERICELETLSQDMWHLLYDWLFKNQEVPWEDIQAVHDRMCALGAEVD